MTKRELMEMLANIEDNEEIKFVVEEMDRDGYPYDTTAKVYRVVKANAQLVRGQYGIERYE